VSQREDSNEGGRNRARQIEKGCIGDDAAFSMSHVQARIVAGRILVRWDWIGKIETGAAIPGKRRPVR
jgi:hypothetical protein